MKSIYVGNLPFDITEDQLRSMFTEHGAVSRVMIVKDRYSGESRGFGFVDMDNDAEGAAAIEALNGSSFSGRSLKVNEARPQTQKPRGGPGGGRPRGGREP